MIKEVNSGFTLIEMLTVIGILTVIGSIAVSVVTVTLRETKKTDLLETARLTGDNTLSQIARSIRYSQTLDAPASCTPPATTSSVTITSLSDQLQTTYSCANNTISSNGASLFDTNSIKVSGCSFVCKQPSVAVPPIITIQYVLSPSSPGGFSETNFTLPFQTSVTLRNIQ